MNIRYSSSVDWHLRSLFWKIFIWFWLAMIAVLLALLLTFAATLNPSNFASERTALLNELNITAHKLENKAEASLLFPLLAISGSHYFLFNKQGHLIGNIAVTNDLLIAYRETHFNKNPVVVFRNALLVVGPRLIILKGRPYQLYMSKQINNLIHWRIQLLVSQQWHLLIAAFIVSFLLCLILAKYLVEPIRQLQRASRKLASGDLAARVCSQVARRQDELGQLGKDFNVMAEQLESVIENKERLLRNVSHELRSPLTRLQLSLALARKKVPNFLAEHDRIELEIGRLDQLISQIIRYSRIKHGRRSALVKERINFKQLLSQLVVDCDFEANARNKSVVLVESISIEVNVVRDFIASAFENIIRNAIRFAPEKTTIEVFLKQIGLYAVIQVRDYGPGVPDNTIKSLFDPFFRVDETRGKENNGTGLGMAIVLSAVELHQGKVKAENVNPGLCITITLPLQLNV